MDRFFRSPLLVAALGIEVAVLARDVKLGRDVFFGNCVIFAVFGILLQYLNDRQD